MTVKTFTSGSILTSADTNEYLANSGLVYVTSAVWNATSTAQINSCFTATYDSYKVFLTTTACTNNTNLYWQLSIGGTPTASNYYWSTWNVSSAGTNSQGSAAPGTSVNPGFTATALPQGQQIIELTFPFDTKNTVFQVFDGRNDTTGQLMRNGGGVHLNSSSHDGIRFGVTGGTLTGVITVYGYRKA
jgi:hypothetical protein